MRQTRLGGTHVEIAERNVPEQSDQHVAKLGFAGAELCRCGFDRAAPAAEQVQFPARVEPGCVRLVVIDVGDDASTSVVVGAACVGLPAIASSINLLRIGSSSAVHHSASASVDDATAGEPDAAWCHASGVGVSGGR
jgi:hypothetical protein